MDIFGCCLVDYCCCGCCYCGIVGLFSKRRPTSDVGAAREYEEVKGSSDPNSSNCYSFAIGSSVNEQPGGTSGRYPKDDSDVRDVGKSVEPI